MIVKIGDLPELLNTKEIPTCTPKTVVRAAAEMMAAKDIGAIPVLDKDGRVVGIFSERDLMKRVSAAGKKLDHTTVEEVMTKKPQTVTLDISFSDATEYMVKGDYRHLPIVDDDQQLIGMLSIKNFMALNWSQMLARTGKLSVAAFLKSPQAFAMIIGFILYGAVMLTFF